MINNETIVDEIVDRYPPEVIVFIGAGASVSFGMPLMNEFFNRYFGKELTIKNSSIIAKGQNLEKDELLALCILTSLGAIELINTNENKPNDIDAEINVDLEDVLSYLINMRDKIENFEKSYGSIPLDAFHLAISSIYGIDILRELSKKGSSLVNIFENFSNKIINAIDHLAMRIYDVYGGDTNDEKFISPILSRYRQFFYSLIGKKGITRNIIVFTTNYDPCLDIYFEKSSDLRNWVYLDGIDHLNKSDIWRLENYLVPTRPHPVIAYFNLHGSVLWTKRGNISISKRKLNEKPEVQSTDQISIIPPILHKKKDIVFEELYDLYAKMCNNSNLKYYINIGYSYRNDEIPEITIEGLKNNESNIISISPKASKSIFCTEFNKRHFPFDCKFEDYHTIAQSIIRTLGGKP